MFLNNKCPRKGHWSLFCRNTTLFFLFLVSKQYRLLWILISFTFLGSFVPLLCLIACYVPHHSDSHHLLSHTLLWWPWPTPFGQATHRFVRGICRNLYLYCVVSWPHIGAAKWNFWMVKSLTLPQLAPTWVWIFEHFEVTFPWICQLVRRFNMILMECLVRGENIV